MSTFTETHARQSDDAYRRDEFKPPHPYEIRRVVETPSGYRGIIYKNTETNEYVVAHTGTEFDTDKIRDIALTDAQMLLLKANQQLDDARDTVELAIEMAKQDGTSVTVTGHSLGGFLAQVTAYEYGLRGETFNAYGAAGLYGVPEGGSRVINHVRATDMVGAANRHYGEVRVYATQQDVDALFKSGPLPSQQSRWELIGDLRRLGPDATHGAVQFHGSHRTSEQMATYGPNTIISHENQAIYQQHKTEFDAYRESIRSAAEDMTLTVKFTGAGVAYSSAIGTQHLVHKIRHGMSGNDVHDEVSELRRGVQRTVDAANSRFVPPDEPAIYRNSAGDPLREVHEKMESLLRQPGMEDSQCKPGPGSGWPTRLPAESTPDPLSLRDDPLAYINQMVAAHDMGDLGTFRQMTQAAANDPYARLVQTTAAAQVDCEEHYRSMMQQLAEQQRNEPTQQAAMSAGMVRSI